MTYYYYNSKTFNSFGDVWYSFKETLKSAGWTVTSSGTGTSGTYNASGDNLLSGNDFGTMSWWVCEHPTLDGYKRYLSVQITTNTARIKMAWAPYSSGSPNANTVPGSADEKILFGSGTDASPTQFTFMNSTLSSNNIYISAGNSSEKYSFYFISFASLTAPTGTSVNCLLGMQYMQNTNALDIDPYIYIMQTAFYPVDLFSYNNRSVFGWTAKGRSNPVWNQYYSDTFGSFDTGRFVGNIGNNPYDNSIDLFPVLFARPGLDNADIKGICRDMYVSLAQRAPLFTLSVNSQRDKIFFSPFLLFNHSGAKPII